GWLNCLDLATGKKIWSRNVIEENQSHVGDWGVAGSPLVVDQKVIVQAGGKAERSLVAYHVTDGQFLWGAGKEALDYSSPTLVRLAGQAQILMFNPSGVAAHDPATGRVLWRHPWPGKHPHVAVPLVLPGDRVLISSGYGTGAELVKVTGPEPWTPTRLWKSN